jgi:hypothetical protein
MGVPLTQAVGLGFVISPLCGSKTWQVESEAASIPLDDSAPAGVTDVHSGSEDVALDGTAYASW